MSVNRRAVVWFDEAVEDLETGKKLFEASRYAHACFHAQQAAEKALEALIVARLHRIEHSHDLVELYEHVSSFVKLECADKLPALSAFYTQARYPNAGLLRRLRR
ncbi:MAG: HEPN domain-containing protein [Aigarchaeota archaeon]|nr:HEPN domain-containing protein [Candidatus Pelearchaeum maunauluense]